MSKNEVTAIVVDKDMLRVLLALAECEVETRIAIEEAEYDPIEKAENDKVLVYFQRLLA